jgi:endonuclease/exonuclease/phosphatase family metal-dependent hydrolase
MLCAAGVLLAAQTGLADTLRVVTQNALDFSGQSATTRIPYFRTVMRAIHPDLVLVEEMGNEQAMDLMLAQVFAQIDTDWTTASFMYNGSLNQVCFYRMSKLALVSQRAIRAEPRNINEFVLRPAVGDTSVRLHALVTHLKASQGYEEERRQEADSARKATNLFPAGTNFFICGDFNLYTSTEPAYQTMITPGTNANGQFFDPINRPGDWNNNGSFAGIHTQSTRTGSESDGGASGGLDDRFDFILVSAALMDTVGSHVIPGTYHSFGNDGQHFNQSIDDGTNHSVPDSVAYALHHQSDHLPVVVDMVLRSEPTAIAMRPAVPREMGLVVCYPNPFNSVLSIELPPVSGAAALTIYDLLGRPVYERSFRGDGVALRPLQVDFSAYGTGTYFVQWHTPAASSVQRVSYVR